MFFFLNWKCHQPIGSFERIDRSVSLSQQACIGESYLAEQARGVERSKFMIVHHLIASLTSNANIKDKTVAPLLVGTERYRFGKTGHSPK